MCDMDHARLRFSREEYAARLEKTRQEMSRRNVDLLIVSDPSNMAWLTGYDGWSFYVYQCVIVPLSGEPIWFGREQDANGARRTAWISEENILGYPDIYVQSPERHPMTYLAAKILERGGRLLLLAWRWIIIGFLLPLMPR